MLPPETIPFLLKSVLLCTLMMSFLWVLYRFTDKASWVDVGWAFGIGMLSVVYFFSSSSRGLRHYLMLLMVLIWSFRLSSYLFFRVLKHSEDARYIAIKERWSGNLPLKFFFFFQFQGFLDVLLATPALLVFLEVRQEPNILEWVAFMVWIIAISGESLADRQLKNFKAKKENKGQLCQIGLWKYSRHPNYFFEFLIWCSFSLFAISTQWGWVTISIPLLMLYFLLCVTGIPETEKQALKTKGELYQEYQKTTSAFIPWFPKKRKEN